ncbi:MAG: F0F1 ATP synthase subunit B [bacterium]|nr:F0F1 ATP synthase subunit B [bacterium]
MKSLACSWMAIALCCFAFNLCLAQQSESGSGAVDAEISESTDAAEESHASEDHADEHGAAHGGEHDLEHQLHQSDPTHGNISDATMELVSFRSDKALFSAIVFLLLLAGLYFTAWKPILEGLEKRERHIADNILHAEQASQSADAKLAEYEAKLASASEEAQLIVAEARKDAEATGQKLIASAQEESARIRERATADIESAKRVALGELADESAEVAMALAKRIVGREVKAEDHQGLIQEMLAKLPSNN